MKEIDWTFYDEEVPLKRYGLYVSHKCLYFEPYIQGKNYFDTIENSDIDIAYSNRYTQDSDLQPPRGYYREDNKYTKTIKQYIIPRYNTYKTKLHRMIKKAEIVNKLKYNFFWVNIKDSNGDKKIYLNPFKSYRINYILNINSDAHITYKQCKFTNKTKIDRMRNSSTSTRITINFFNAFFVLKKFNKNIKLLHETIIINTMNNKIFNPSAFVNNYNQNIIIK